MAHDYLFRRISKTTHAAWNWAFGGTPPEGAAAEPPAAKGHVSTFARGRRMAPRSAYALTESRFDLDAGIVAESPADGAAHFSRFARGPRRTSREAYWIPPQYVPEIHDTPLPEGRGHFAERSPGARRAASHAYWAWHPALPPENVESPAPFILMPERAPGARRAASHAYWAWLSISADISAGKQIAACVHLGDPSILQASLDDMSLIKAMLDESSLC